MVSRGSASSARASASASSRSTDPGIHSDDGLPPARFGARVMLKTKALMALVRNEVERPVFPHEVQERVKVRQVKLHRPPPKLIRATCSIRAFAAISREIPAITTNNASPT